MMIGEVATAVLAVRARNRKSSEAGKSIRLDDALLVFKTSEGVVTTFTNTDKKQDFGQNDLLSLP